MDAQWLLGATDIVEARGEEGIAHIKELTDGFGTLDTGNTNYGIQGRELTTSGAAQAAPGAMTIGLDSSKELSDGSER